MPKINPYTEIQICPFYIYSTYPDENKGNCDIEGECAALWLGAFENCERHNMGQDKILVEKANDPFLARIISEHYFYSSSKGKISLICMPNYFRDGRDVWEAYPIDCDLFEDEMRFYSRQNAENFIIGILSSFDEKIKCTKEDPSKCRRMLRPVKEESCL